MDVCVASVQLDSIVRGTAVSYCWTDSRCVHCVQCAGLRERRLLRDVLLVREVSGAAEKKIKPHNRMGQLPTGQRQLLEDVENGV